MHADLKHYLKDRKPLVNKGDKVLDVGSFNFNGAVRDVLPVTVGADMRDGDGVDLVCLGEDLPEHFEEGHFDMVISCDTLEHVESWREFLEGMWHVLKPNGTMIISIAHLSKKRHAYPDDYWRLTETHINDIFIGNPVSDITDLRKVSLAWTVTKNTDKLVDLADIHLIPVDGKVPEHLLPKD